MPGMIEHGLGVAIGFVTKPVGAAVATAAVAAVVGGGFALKNWWEGIEAKDGIIVDLRGQVTEVTGSLRQAQMDATSARTEFARREADLQHQIQVTEGEAAAQRQRVARLSVRIAELQNDETGPLAPVLIHALDSVRDDLRGLTPVA